MCCHLLGGGKQLVEHIEQTLGIKNGETTADGLITLEVTGECLAACDLAPVIHVNTEYAVKMTPAKFDALVEALRSGKGPEAFLEQLPLMGGASQDEWQGFKPVDQVCGCACGAKADETSVTEEAPAAEPASTTEEK
jgi:NADH-quinone oxidoreductase subunit E